MIQRLVIPLQSQAEVHDIVAEVKDLLSGQECCIGGFYGRVEEDTDMLEVIIFWESAEAYNASKHQFAKTGSHNLSTDYLVKLSNIPSAVFTSPIVEMLTFHDLPADFNEDGLAGFLAMVSNTEGCLGMAKGPIVQELVDEGTASDGPSFLVTIGWESLEANIKG